MSQQSDITAVIASQSWVFAENVLAYAVAFVNKKAGKEFVTVKELLGTSGGSSAPSAVAKPKGSGGKAPSPSSATLAKCEFVTKKDKVPCTEKEMAPGVGLCGRHHKIRNKGAPAAAETPAKKSSPNSSAAPKSAKKPQTASKKPAARPASKEKPAAEPTIAPEDEPTDDAQPENGDDAVPENGEDAPPTDEAAPDEAADGGEDTTINPEHARGPGRPLRNPEHDASPAESATTPSTHNGRAGDIGGETGLAMSVLPEDEPAPFSGSNGLPEPRVANYEDLGGGRYLDKQYGFQLECRDGKYRVLGVREDDGDLRTDLTDQEKATAIKCGYRLEQTMPPRKSGGKGRSIPPPAITKGGKPAGKKIPPARPALFDSSDA